MTINTTGTDALAETRRGEMLNPCGCGGEAEIGVLTGLNEAQYVKAICQSCGNQTTECETREEATEEWNTAHPLPQPKPRTNFEKWATLENISKVFCKPGIGCFDCPACSFCIRKTNHDCKNDFLEWANAPAKR